MLNFCPTKKPAPKMGRVSTLEMWYFIATLFSPQRKGSPHRHVAENRRGLLFRHVVHLAGVYLCSMSIVFCTF
nr:MAG TPA: hypothetical protein [Caudoviricetes sp.]